MYDVHIEFITINFLMFIIGFSEVKQNKNIKKTDKITFV